MSLAMSVALVGLGLLGLALALVYQVRHRPKYLMTVTKTVDVNRPESVTLQMNFPAGTSHDAMWEELERGANVAVSRADTVNAEILQVVAADTAQIKAKQDALRTENAEEREGRKRRKVARRLGLPVDTLTKEDLEDLMNGRVSAPELIRRKNGHVST